MPRKSTAATKPEKTEAKSDDKPEVKNVSVRIPIAAIDAAVNDLGVAGIDVTKLNGRAKNSFFQAWLSTKLEFDA